jgi:protein phosphatase
MILESSAASHPGLVRQNNEDSHAARVPDDAALQATRGALFAVADGVGGENAGEVASRTAIDALLEEYFSPRAPHQVEAALRQAVQAANLRVYNLAHGRDVSLQRMQTTLTAAVIAGPQAYVAHAGDSRAYLLRGSHLTQLTADHSEAAELLRLRLITPEQARNHPRRSVLTRTLGNNLLLRPDFARQPLQPGDRLLICSDGLWGEVGEEDLIEAARLPVDVGCERLVELACAHGGGDNVTVQLIHAAELDPAPPAPAGRIARLLSGLRGG